MKKITYCKQCGSKIVDENFCPICGEKINNEVKNMGKNRRTRKILLIILAITIIAGVLMVGTALLNHNQTVQITETASIEMPVGNGINSSYVTGTQVHKVSNGKGMVVMAYNSKNSNLAGAFGFDVVKAIAVGDIDNNDKIHETTINGSTKYSIATVNEATGDHILITTHSKDDTMKIYHSIKYNASNVKNTTNNTINKTTTTNQQQSGNTANNQQKALAYRSDGTPMYDYREVDSYMERKYGDKVDYHIQDNGYISHDGYRQSGQESTPYNTGGRGSGSGGSTAT